MFIRDFDVTSNIDNKLKFNWKVAATNTNDSSFNITLNFTNPHELSATSQPEFVQVKFNYPEYFQSLAGNPLTTNRAVKRIPKQWANSFLWGKLEKVTSSARKVGASLVSGSVALNYLLSASLALIWGLINSMQTMTVLPLTEVTYPKNALALNAVVLTIATFDVIPAGTLILKIFKLSSAKPFSDAFEAYGISNTQFMLSLGTTFVIFFGSIVVFPLMQVVVYLLDRRFGKDGNIVRRLQEKVVSSYQFSYYIRSVLEFYLDLSLSALINFYSLKSSFNGLSGDRASAVFTLIATAIVIGAPIAAGCLLWHKRNQLEEESFKARFGELTAEIKRNRYLYVVLFMLRRLLLAFIFVCMRGLCVIQIMCLAYQ